MIRTARVAAALAITLSLSACAQLRRGPAGDLPEEPIAVTVQNNNWASVALYCVRPGLTVRMGAVESMNSADFDLPLQCAAGGSFQLVAAPLAGRSRYTTPAISVHGGRWIMLTVENQLALSSYMILH